MTSAALVRAHDIRLTVIVNEERLVARSCLQDISDPVLYILYLEIARGGITLGKQHAVVVPGNKYILL